MDRNTQRELAPDLLKGIAIISVVLYHFCASVLPYGYLGVDVFFVISGYFLIRQLFNQFVNGSFKYSSFFFSKLIRLWPLVILASIVSLAVGYYLMLPNDYENLSESVVASSCFANNILQCITTKNYWDIVNLYKPLMHFWYVGVLMQSYIILPLLYLIAVKIGHNIERSIKLTTGLITIISMIMFLFPSFSSAWKFYYFPFRLFEITAGGLLAFISSYSQRFTKKTKTLLSYLSLFILIFVLCFRWDFIPKELLLLTTVTATISFMFFCNITQIDSLFGKLAYCFAAIGKMSYSVYIWHQVIIAFLFYSIFPEQNFISFFVFVISSVLISLLSYFFIEKPLVSVSKNKKTITRVIICSVVLAILISGVSLFFYLHADVVRDVPELRIQKEFAHRGMHSDYCDRVYSWNRPFSTESEIKVLVIGNSFGRDWANVLYEYDQNLDISFFYFEEKSIESAKERIDEADFVFYAQGLDYGKVPDIITEIVDRSKLYIISNKNYGESNGIIYAQRHSENYLNQTVTFKPELKEDIANNELIWNSHFINMMSPVLNENGKIRVFTDDGHFISQDCRHLTQDGAQFYAAHLDLRVLFEK